MGRVKAHSLRLGEAAELLELSYRQAKRIWARYRAGGAKALQHGNCGRVSNRAYTAKFRAAVLTRVQARYEDFYEQANAYLDEHYLAEHNRRYAHAAVASADYHRRRPTARQLDEVFWLEEERVVSEDWVVRYNNRLLQLERKSQHWAPARSRVRVRQTEA